jgi:hypothetical protein
MTIESYRYRFRSLFRLTTLPFSRAAKPLKWGAIALTLAIAALGTASALSPARLQASDHDDGDIDVRSRALSLTDLYFFRESDQNPEAKADDLILVMNTNPRSVARQQYFFSTQARYEIKLSRVANINSTPTGIPDTTLRFTFGPPRNNRQAMTLSLIDRDGNERAIGRDVNNRTLLTTALNDAPNLNEVKVGNQRITVFAGLREDPFFFDVEQYFRVRAAILGFGPAVNGFRSPQTAIDFAKGYNVNAIVVRIPRKLLQAGTNVTAFDAWLTISIPDPRTGKFVQTEELARPGINELLTTGKQNIYAAFNRTQPTRAKNSATNAVRADIKTFLLALGNPDARAEALLNTLLPDVMRNDTSGPSGYGADPNAPLTRGRKLLDDVVDVSLSVLTQGAVTSDNVSYTGTSGNPAQGHQPLSATFPYLAPPN